MKQAVLAPAHRGSVKKRIMRTIWRTKLIYR